MNVLQTVAVAVCVGLALAYTLWRAWCQWRAMSPPDDGVATTTAGATGLCGTARSGCAGCSGCGSGRR